MAQSVIGALRVNLGLDSARFMKGAGKADKRLRDMGRQFTRVAGLATAFGAAVTAAAQKGAQEIDRSAKAARRLDLSIGSFRGLQLAASEAGVSLSSLTNDVQTMNREIANIGTSGNAMRSLERLGLSLSDIQDADSSERLAIIADRIKAMGMSAGEATAILRDFGVRNRETALLMLQGGDAIRDAQKDIDAYGLALNDVDASQIEQANDRMARLGFITQYVGQQLALQLVPAMGRMAQAMTDSLKEGGRLRAVLDGLTNNIDRILTYISTAVAMLGTRYVAALVAARLATLNFGKALIFLRGALIRTGFGALVVLIGEGIFQLGKIVEATGGFGNALKALGDVASAVWGGITTTLSSFVLDFRAMGADLKGIWVKTIQYLADKWAAFVSVAAPAINAFSEATGANLQLDPIAAQAYASSLAHAASNADALGERLRQNASDMRSGAFSGVTEAVGRLRNLMVETGEAGETSVDRITGSVEELDTALGGAGGSGAGGPAGGIDKLKTDIKDLGDEGEDSAKKIENTFSSAFEGLVTGSKSLNDALSDVLGSFAQMAANAAFQGLWNGSGIGSIVGSLIPAHANGTNFAPGGLSLVGERGPELVNLPRGSQVIPNRRLAGALGGGGQQNVHVTVSVDQNGNFQAYVKDTAAAMSQATVQQYSRYGQPARQAQINTKPRWKG